MNKEDCECENLGNSIEPLNLEEMPSSSFNIIMGSRRSGKSYLTEFIVKKMIDAGQVDCCFLFSRTNASFDFIQHDCRFKEIDELSLIVENYRVMNIYNQIQPKKKKQFQIKTIIIIDDMVVEMKSKKFNILESLATLGRHYAYDPLSLHFFILSQSLTKIPRVVRLNCDHIFMNNIASSIERDMILQENFYRVASGRKNNQIGRDLYYSLVTKEDFIFLVVENHRQNIKEYKDYIKTIKAD